jgi:hypothetical protein
LLYGKPSNLEHILSTCQKALFQGRYTWRYDKLLAALADDLENEWKKKRDISKTINLINCRKDGQNDHNKNNETGLFKTAGD